jgi:hypothetical protein
MNVLPFVETRLDDSVYLREFSQETDSGEFMWHRDREDRIVEAVGDTDWMVQLDDELPISLNGKVSIPMGVYHRLIKGTGDLKIKVTKKPL